MDMQIIPAVHTGVTVDGWHGSCEEKIASAAEDSKNKYEHERLTDKTSLSTQCIADPALDGSSDPGDAADYSKAVKALKAPSHW
jgi:hypothetical protein